MEDSEYKHMYIYDTNSKLNIARKQWKGDGKIYEGTFQYFFLLFIATKGI